MLLLTPKTTDAEKQVEYRNVMSRLGYAVCKIILHYW